MVLSTQSIEQVDQVHPDLIKILCDLSPEMTGVHFEPIGWQFPGSAKGKFIEKHQARCKSLKIKKTSGTFDSSSV